MKKNNVLKGLLVGGFSLMMMLMSVNSPVSANEPIDEGGVCRCHTNEGMCLTGHDISFRARCECGIVFRCVEPFEDTID